MNFVNLRPFDPWPLRESRLTVCRLVCHLGGDNMHFRFALAVLLALTGTAAAQTWPDRPVRIIVSHKSAGGTPDIVARLIADRLSTNLKQQFIIEIALEPRTFSALRQAHARRLTATFLFATAAALASNPLHVRHPAL